MNLEQQARQLKNNPLLKKLFEERAEEIAAEWGATEPSDAEARERKYAELRALIELEEYISARISIESGDG